MRLFLVMVELKRQSFVSFSIFFFSSRRRHTRFDCDWSSDVCSSDLEALLVALEGRFHVLLVVRVSLEHFILCDQPLGTLGEKNFVAELHWRLHLAALDEIGVGFKDGIDLFRVGNLLSFEHPTARLVDHPVSQFAVVVDLLAEFADGHFRDQTLAACFAGLLHYLSCTVHHFFVHANEFAIFLGLSFLPFLGRHPLDFLHPAPRYSRVIRKALNTLRNRFPQAADQARDHAYDVPQQGVIRRSEERRVGKECRSRWSPYH